MKTKNPDTGLLILRLSIGIMFFLHGLSKVIHGISWMEGMLQGDGLPGFIAYGSIIGEFVAPLFIIAGYRTRIASLVMAFDMVMAIVLVHLGTFFSLNKGGGWAIELPALYLFGAIVLFFTGAGKYALSAKNNWD